MNQKTAKLIKTCARKTRTRERELKETWNETPRPERRKLRAFLRAALVILLFLAAGCCRPQVVGETEMAGIIESQDALFEWLEGYIVADPKLSEAEKTIRLGEIEQVEKSSKGYLKLLKGGSDGPER